MGTHISYFSRASFMIPAHVLSLIEPQRVLDFFLLGRFSGSTARAGHQAPQGALFSARAAPLA
jgi:hypothetical protein